ncbi:MAG: NAD(+) synthase [Bacteroidetes bacterium]|nr:NAD(+) synthase [Bacteroidota bacterium]
MRRIHIGGAALNQTPLDWEGNYRRIREVLRAARNEGIQLLCLPELCLTGYGCEDAFLQRSTPYFALELLAQLSVETQDLVTCLGLPLSLNGKLYNATALCVDGRIQGFYAKRHLAGDGLHYEPRWFTPFEEDEEDFVRFAHDLLEFGDKEAISEELGLPEGLALPGEEYPVQTVPFTIEGVRIGFEICEDAWMGNRAASYQQSAGVDVLLNPSASHFAFGKTRTRQQIVLEGSRAFGCIYVLANLLGNEAGRAIYDGEILIAQNGRLLAQNRRFSFREWNLTTAIADLEEGFYQKQRTFGYRPSPQADLLSQTAHPRVLADVPRSLTPECPVRQDSKEEELYRALTLGLWDYMRKSGSRGFVISLSGGADSGACAVLATRALQEARAELSEKEMLHMAPQLEGLLGEGLVQRLVTCIYQATENNGQTTLNSARTLAQGLGADFHVWDVQPLLNSYRQLGEEALGRLLDWEQDDVTLQNIQARLRAPGIWLVANAKGALLLATSNRSEMAVGYATMDGDTAGGLAPLGGLDKPYLLQWLHWAEHHLGIQSLAPLNELKPSAELRPPVRSQTDEGDLMPYPLLDAIEREAIALGKDAGEVFRTLKATGQWKDTELRNGIRKFFTLWRRNQWKRERYAPSFHLDSHNLDPRSWMRYPILSGGLDRDLRELKGKR